MESRMEDEQTAFRKGRGTTGNIFLMKNVMEKK